MEQLKGKWYQVSLRELGVLTLVIAYFLASYIVGLNSVLGRELTRIVVFRFGAFDPGFLLIVGPLLVFVLSGVALSMSILETNSRPIFVGSAVTNISTVLAIRFGSYDRLSAWTLMPYSVLLLLIAILIIALTNGMRATLGEPKTYLLTIGSTFSVIIYVVAVYISMDV